MKSAATAIAMSVCCAACSGAEPFQPAPLSVEAGKPVSLKIGQSAQAVDRNIRFGFERVASDSRCAKGEQCVWAGDAVVRIWLQRGDGPRQMRELHPAASPVSGVGVADRDVRLLRLDPWPVAGTAIASADYVATLALTDGPAADPDR